MRIQAVTFDVGGTLIEPWPSVGQIYADVALRHGAGDVTAELLQTRFSAAWRARKDFNDTRRGWEELVDEVFLGLVAPPPSRSFFPELYDRFSQPGAWRVFDDVRPALETLRARGFKLGVISNWDERLRPLLRPLRLEAYFGTIIVSCEAGCAKPAPGIFLQAAAAMNLPPAAIAHVGDSLEMDVQGAERAGFHGLHIQRGAAGAGEPSLRRLTDLDTKLAMVVAKKDKPL